MVIKRIRLIICALLLLFVFSASNTHAATINTGKFVYYVGNNWKILGTIEGDDYLLQYESSFSNGTSVIWYIAKQFNTTDYYYYLRVDIDANEHLGQLSLVYYPQSANAPVTIAGPKEVNITTPGVTPRCGNGNPEDGEACDLGSNNGVCPAKCSTACKVNTCGGTTDPGAGTGTASAAATGPFTFNIGDLTATPTIDNTGCATGQTKFTKGILAGLPCDKAIDSLADVLKLIRNIMYIFILPIVGTLFVIMIIVGGIVYMSSAANPKRIELGKKILTAAIIGLIITILAYTIVFFFAKSIGG